MNYSALSDIQDTEINEGNTIPRFNRPSDLGKGAVTIFKNLRKGEKGFYIGVHKEDNALPVYARYYSNGPLNCRVYHEDCSIEAIARHHEFFSKKAQCTMEAIKFDEHIFAGLDIQNLSVEEQKTQVRKYLASMGIHPPHKQTTEQLSETTAKKSSAQKTSAVSDEFSGASNVTANNTPTKKMFQPNKDDLIRAQDTKIYEQEETIARLQEQIRQLSQPGRGTTPFPETNFEGKRVVGGQIYQIFGSGPNAGKLITKSRQKVDVNGKYYEEWQVLSEIKLNMGYTGYMVEVQELGAMTFYRVPNGEHEGCFVQVISEDSLFEAAEGKFIKWTVRKELEDTSKNLQGRQRGGIYTPGVTSCSKQGRED